MTSSLPALGARIERLGAVPTDGGLSFARLVGRLFGTSARPKVETARLAALIDRIELGFDPVLMPRHLDPARQAAAIAELRSNAERVEPVGDVLAGALRELEHNIERAERTLFVHGHLPDGHIDWLWRLHQVARRAHAWIDDPGHRPLWREVVCPEARRVLSPLTTSAAHGRSHAVRGVDPLIDAATAEVRSPERQRRLLEAARQQLFEARAAHRLDAAADGARRALISRRIARLDRLEAAGVSPNIDLPYQLREALHRGEVQRLHATLVALEDGAHGSGDDALARLAGQAIDGLWGYTSRYTPKARTASLEQSQEQLFGPRLRPLIESGYVAAMKRLGEVRAKDHSTDEDAFIYTDAFFDKWELYFTAGATSATLAAATASDGCFDVGAGSALVPGRAAPGEAKVVDVPTQELVLDTAATVDDLPSALIEDPRSILLDLAAGKLLARRYLAPQPTAGAAWRLKNEVRVYVLDGSTSMLGSRARVRDALLLAELSTLSARLLELDREGNPTVYYRYFNQKVGETHRVASLAEAEAAVGDILGSVHFGGTDIQRALLSSFEQIRQARQADPDLARAQIVLVTDGESDIDEELVQRAREALGDLPIGVSIIALGDENPALRALAAHQRARGERVSYQYLDDVELRQIVDGDTAGLPIHLPAGAGPDRLSAEVRAVLADIDRHLRRADTTLVERARELPAALEEVGLPATTMSQATRARVAAAENDRVTLGQAFMRIFPLPAAGLDDEATDPSRAPSPEEADVLIALATVAEIVETFGISGAECQADAIELVERLLSEANVTPWAYADVVGHPSAPMLAALRAVHAAANFPR